HAPNHRHIKGTEYFIKAVDELQAEGYSVELVIFERVSNDEIQKAIQEADIIADQLIIGWYAMFAIEAMAMGKPVLCYLRDDFIRLYEYAKLIEKDEIPIVNCSLENVKEKIKALLLDRSSLVEIGERSRRFVQKHHSIEAIGKVFDTINQAI